MVKLQTEINEFSIIKETARATTSVFLSEPKPDEEKKLGRLFAIVEIDSKNRVNKEIIDLMIHDINRYYYGAQSYEIEAGFENALQKTNRRLQEMIGEVGEEWLKQLTALIGVQKNNEIVFANVGKAIALMSHNNSIIDILDTAKAKAQDVSPVKIFSNIVTGEVTEGARILFATETILDYLSKEKIRRVLAEHDGKKVSNVFYELLEQNANDVNLVSLILEHQTEIPAEVEVAPATPKKRVKKVPKELVGDSMEDLQSRQEDTEELLSSSLWPSVKKHMREKANDRTEEKNVAEQYNDEILSGPGSLHPQAQKRNGDWKSIARNSALVGAAAAKKGILSAKNASVATYKKLRSKPTGVAGIGEKKKTAALDQQPANTATKRVNTSGVEKTLARALTPLVKWVRALTLIQKIFFALAIIVLIIFAQAVIDRDDSQETQAEETSHAQTISEIDLKINEGKAAVLFNKDEAEKLLNEASDLLATIPQDSKSYQDRGAELERVIQDEINRINKVTELFDTKSVVDFSSIVDSIDVKKMVLLGGTVYGFDASNGSIYRGNTENGETTVALSDAESRAVVSATKASPGTALLAKEGNALSLYNPIEEKVTELDLPDDGVKITPIDVAVFGTRLYVLDPTNNQIYRYDEVSGGYSSASEWIADDVNVETAVSLAIDANVYVLKQNGTVVKMAGGFQEEFELESLEPAIESAEKISTDENSDFLYILDSANQRVVVFDKEGAVVNQYTSESFTNIRDMSVDEEEKKLFILNGTQVIAVDMTHLGEDGSEADSETVDE